MSGMVGRLARRRLSGKVLRAKVSTGPPTLERIFLPSLTVCEEYVLRPFPARIVHFLAADLEVSTRVLTDPRRGWADFAEGGLEEHYLAGDHASIFTDDPLRRPWRRAFRRRLTRSRHAQLRSGPAPLRAGFNDARTFRPHALLSKRSLQVGERSEAAQLFPLPMTLANECSGRAPRWSKCYSGSRGVWHQHRIRKIGGRPDSALRAEQPAIESGSQPRLRARPAALGS